MNGNNYTILKTLTWLKLIVLTRGYILVEIMDSKFELLPYLKYYIDMGEDKYKIIRGVYYDADSDVGSINDIYKQSHRILNTITLNGVN